MRYIFDIFGDIPGIFVDYLQIILDFLHVCQSVSQSLIFLPINYFWGSTFGLVHNQLTQKINHEYLKREV